MPEGDTIFRTARTLQRALAGEKILSFESVYAPLAAANDNEPLAGRIIERVEARGKWLLIYFSGDIILLTHMLMNGSWHIYRRGERWQRPRCQMRIVITTEKFEAVAFEVPVAQFHTVRSLERHTSIPKLGPDLLKSSFAEDDAAARLRAYPEEEVGNVLLNQQVMAGIGNVFKSEICFACGIHPFRKVRTLTNPDLQCLIDTARKQLSANVLESSTDGPVTYSGARRTRHTSDEGARLWVYSRKGKQCRRCGTVIEMRKQGPGARSTYWCPECQPAQVNLSDQI
ncbi:Fpg/Nei family DNA glycosylase [Acidobacterium sp. S8]|uniref:Fpg/Nei family DNA glycosylase n=1 Tax=Acidobacterium sp. S8 TaxID=1641854 RepID=UPI00131E4BF0|nr:DNA-formamidopyrimidine glycosylase family protein [Acidobacterium sp. S8]